MNNLTKLGIAGSLALGSVGAHASITVPTSSGNPGDVVLFADIFNGTTLVAAYAGDTGVAVTSVGGGTRPTGTFDDANLSTFLSEATTGTTVLWAVEGGGGNVGPAPYLVTSSPKVGQLINATTGSILTNMGTGLANQIININGLIGGSATSWLGTNDSQASGTGFNPTALASDVSNWYGAVANVAQTGLGVAANLYTLTAAGQNNSNDATTTAAAFTVSLTSAGLVYNSPTVTPLPAAVWLLGSGLLGLAGVGRRKSKAA
jgi:hypothetical protein